MWSKYIYIYIGVSRPVCYTIDHGTIFQITESGNIIQEPPRIHYSLSLQSWNIFFAVSRLHESHILQMFRSFPTEPHQMKNVWKSSIAVLTQQFRSSFLAYSPQKVIPKKIYASISLNLPTMDCDFNQRYIFDISIGGFDQSQVPDSELIVWISHDHSKNKYKPPGLSQW